MKSRAPCEESYDGGEAGGERSTPGWPPHLSAPSYMPGSGPGAYDFDAPEAPEVEPPWRAAPEAPQMPVFVFRAEEMEEGQDLEEAEAMCEPPSPSILGEADVLAAAEAAADSRRRGDPDFDRDKEAGSPASCEVLESPLAVESLNTPLPGPEG